MGDCGDAGTYELLPFGNDGGGFDPGAQAAPLEQFREKVTYELWPVGAPFTAVSQRSKSLRVRGWDGSRKFSRPSGARQSRDRV